MIVCDTGPLVAPALSNESDHRACVELFTALHAARRELLVPATVIAVGGYLLVVAPVNSSGFMRRSDAVHAGRHA